MSVPTMPAAVPQASPHALPSLVTNIHRAALSAANGIGAPVQYMQIEEAHRLALVEAEAEVYGASRAAQLMQLASWAVRAAVQESPDPVDTAKRLTMVASVTAAVV